MKDAGCQPPHWKSKFDLPICSDADQMSHFSDQPPTTETESFVPPCKVIDQLDYTFYEKSYFEEG